MFSRAQPDVQSLLFLATWAPRRVRGRGADQGSQTDFRCVKCGFTGGTFLPGRGGRGGGLPPWWPWSVVGRGTAETGEKRGAFWDSPEK